jgi:hypothetical protein
VGAKSKVTPVLSFRRGRVREGKEEGSGMGHEHTVLYEDVAIVPAGRSHRVRISVTLTSGGRTETAEEEVADTQRARVEGAARAAVAVLDGLLEGHALVLEGAKVVGELDQEVAFAVVRGMGGRESVTLTGTAQVRHSPEQAAVLAVLDATNRWAQARRTA